MHRDRIAGLRQACRRRNRQYLPSAPP
jgi:hypothetical protein